MFVSFYRSVFVEVACKLLFNSILLWHCHRHPFNGLFSRTVWVSQHQKD